jgi:hypothetical protein
MNAFQNKSAEFVKEFIYSGKKLDMVFNFDEEKKGIPFVCWVEKKTKGEDFEWFYLMIKLNIEDGSLVSITLNHPTLTIYSQNHEERCCHYKNIPPVRLKL